MRKTIYKFDNGKMYAKTVSIRDFNIRGFVAELWTKDIKLIYESAHSLLVTEPRTPEQIKALSYQEPYLIFHIKNAKKRFEPEVVKYRERVGL